MAWVGTSLGSTTNTTGATLALTVAANAPAGAIVFVFTGEVGTTTAAGTCADSKGNLYSKPTSSAANANNAAGWNGIYWSILATPLVSGVDTITYTKTTSGNGASVSAAVYTGNAPISPIDIITTPTTGNTTAITITSGVASQVNELFVGMSGCNSAAHTYTQAAGWTTTAPIIQPTTAIQGVCPGFLVNAGTAAQTYAPTINSSVQWSDMLISVKPGFPVAAEFVWGDSASVPDNTIAWQGTPKASSTLQLLTAQGQVPPYRFYFAPPESPSWQFPYQALTFPSAFPNNPFTNRKTYWFDEPSFWSGAPAKSNVLQILSAAGKVPPSTWDYWNDDPAVWQGVPTRSLILPILETGQVKPFRWNYTLNDASVWSGSPLRSVVLSALSTAQVPPFTWNYGIDDATTWLEPQRRNIILAQPTAGQPRAPFWAPRPPDITVTPRVIQPFIGTFFPPVVTTPFSNRLTYWYAETPVWVGKPQAATNLQIGSVVFIPRAPFWAPRPADPPVWWAAAIERVTSLYAPLAPFSNRQTWWYSEDAWWTGTPSPADTLSILSNAGIVTAKFWRWDFNVAESAWQSTIREDLILLTTVVGKPLALYRLFADMGYYDAAAVWSGQPLASQSLITPPPPPTQALHAPHFFSTMGMSIGAPANPPS